MVAMLLALSGCGAASNDAQQAKTDAQSLWSLRTPYVGDNSRVIKLVGELFASPGATYTLTLHTARRPYALTIKLAGLAKPFESIDFSEQETLLLGLVGNVDVVSIEPASGGPGHVLTTAAASQVLGHDVKDLGRDQRSLAAYLRAEAD